MEKSTLAKGIIRKSRVITFWELVSQARAYLDSPSEYKLLRLNRSMAVYGKLPAANIKRLMRLRLFVFIQVSETGEGRHDKMCSQIVCNDKEFKR